MNHLHSPSAFWQRKLAAGKIVIIDGATGTELHRRGVPIAANTWNGSAVLSHPQILRAVHEDYIRAGAEVIIANTFGSTRPTMEAAGLGVEVATVNHRGVKLALEARDNVAIGEVAVAGSISPLPPRRNGQAVTREQELSAYREVAIAMAEAGCDLIALEMMNDTNHSPLAMQAAVEVGLPVWLGISCQRTQTGELVGFGRTDERLEDIVDTLLPMGPTVVNLMHTNTQTVPFALAILQDRWSGPVGVYPDSGFLAKRHWDFVDVIPPLTLASEAVAWGRSGVRIFGGCCGTGPEHIRALKEAAPRLRD